MERLAGRAVFPTPSAWGAEFWEAERRGASPGAGARGEGARGEGEERGWKAGSFLFWPCPSAPLAAAPLSPQVPACSLARAPAGTWAERNSHLRQSVHASLGLVPRVPDAYGPRGPPSPWGAGGA